MHRIHAAAIGVCVLLMGHLPLAGANDEGDRYGALIGGLYRPDHTRDDVRGLSLQALYGISSGDYRAWEINAFTQSANHSPGGEDTAVGLGLDVNWGRRQPGQFFLLTGVGAAYEKTVGDNKNVNPYVNVGGGVYLPFPWPSDLVRLEARWNGVFGDDATGQSGLLNDFRLQIGVAFDARRALPEPIRLARAQADAIPDRDADGVADPLDRCPDTPPWLRVDPTGCGPQADTDADGVADKSDLCPDTAAGVAVQPDGCAELGKVVLGDVHFALDSNILTAEGLRALDDVAATLRVHGSTRVEVDGHADATGPAGYNQKLALKRAQAAREFLIYRGVQPQRISVRSFGESQPKASNDTEQGRAQNRRIEFKVVEQKAEGEGPDAESAEIEMISLGDETP